MPQTPLEQFWYILGWIFSLNGDAFRLAVLKPEGLPFAILIVVLAGVSQAIAQSIILFINQVKPLRFFLSLVINALLFAAGVFFLVLSTWLITLLPGSVTVPLETLAIVLGLSYAPLIFSFLGALPYIGVPILSVLSIWHLLAMVVGIASVTQLNLTNSFGYVAFGWIAFQVLQQTLGRPIARFGQWLSVKVAGVDLETDRREIRNLVQSRSQTSATDWQAQFNQRVSQVQQGDLVGVAAGGYPITANSYDAPAGAEPSVFLKPGTDLTETAIASPDGKARVSNGAFWRTLLGLLAMGILTYLVVVFLKPVRDWWFGWYDNLPRLFRFTFDLFWIAIIALVVAGLLAPLETLGWWAGWYDDEVNTTTNIGELAAPVADPQGISRYIIYLDGICQSDVKYLPDVEEFLDTLIPTLPPDVALLRGLMVYSVMNKPLDQDRPLAFLWRLADRNRYDNPADLLGLLVNLRNVIIVAVSADKRYGPLYNQGIAQIVYNGLLQNGYQPGSATPVTIIGYSGGGQMACACAPFLKRALRAPVDVISIGGVISANNNILALEHLYHLVGDKDGVEQLGPIMFPGRWKIWPLSYWNRAKRRGKISIFSMGPVGHQVPGGILCPKLILPDGRSALQQTIDTINAILRGELLPKPDLSAVKPSNYARYQQAAFNQPAFYPLHQTVDQRLYQPIAPWMGRLILPTLEQRQQVRGTLFEVHMAPEEYQHLIGQVVKLRWNRNPLVQRLVAAVKRDVHFSAEASYTSKYGGLVHPDRLNHWLQVDPLESLAGSRPADDLMVMLNQPLEVEGDVLLIGSHPVQITGRYYALVQFLQPIGSEQFQVAHFNRESRQFDGPQEVLSLPQVVLSSYGSYPFTVRDLEKSPLNAAGWYVYGAKDTNGRFVVQALAPRSLLRLQPDEVIVGAKASYTYIRERSWANVVAQKGKISSVLCVPQTPNTTSPIQDAIATWREGDRALVLHVYGGIGGEKAEAAAATPIFFGHFAYGMAQVVRDPIADELCFDIRYYQVYTHNTDGLVAGTLHWSRYMGDRQFGWSGTRPVCDILIKLDAFTGSYDINGVERSPLIDTIAQLQAMTARYRIGDGTGGTYVGPANNCSQDANQALFASIQAIEQQLTTNAEALQQWVATNPEQEQRLRQLIHLGRALERQLQVFGKPRVDWERNEFNLGSTLEDRPLQNLRMGLSSWRTLLPRKASDTVVKVFLDHGASVWVLRTSQIGGHNPEIEPIAPMTL
jgi:predicted Abi (CAAX) family protease